MFLLVASFVLAVQGTTSLACQACAANDHMLLQTASHRFRAGLSKQAVNRTSCVLRPNSHTCCGQCAANGGFCSPRSQTCYDSKRKDYYETCCESDGDVVEETQATCCSACA